MPKFKVGDVLRYKQGGGTHSSFHGKRVRVLCMYGENPLRLELLDAITEGRSFPVGHCYTTSGDADTFEHVNPHPVEAMLE